MRKTEKIKPSNKVEEIFQYVNEALSVEYSHSKSIEESVMNIIYNH